jgi:hypothetical protein
MSSVRSDRAGNAGAHRHVELRLDRGGEVVFGRVADEGSDRGDDHVSQHRLLTRVLVSSMLVVCSGRF